MSVAYGAPGGSSGDTPVENKVPSQSLFQLPRVILTRKRPVSANVVRLPCVCRLLRTCHDHPTKQTAGFISSSLFRFPAIA